MKIKTEKVAVAKRPSSAYVNVYTKYYDSVAYSAYSDIAKAKISRLPAPGALIKLEIDDEGDLVVAIEKEFN